MITKTHEQPSSYCDDFELCFTGKANGMVMERRTLMKSVLAFTLGTMLAPSVNAKRVAERATTMIKPKRLQAGNTIGLVTPASNVWENEEINFAIDILKSFGFKVKQGKYLYQRYGYLAGSDKERAWDINNMFADPQVDGIFCLRGGYGSARILPYLDYQLIKANPKALIGYSDITALLNAITARTGLVTFHGPIARQNFSSYTLEHFKKILFNPVSPTELATPPLFEGGEGQVEENNRVIAIHSGRVTAPLIGGNLSLMVKLIGSEFEPDYSGKILFIEEVEEAPYRLDGMLTHLWLTGRLGKLAGIVFGKCTDCEAKDVTSLSIEQVLTERLLPLNIPVLSGLMIGHIEDNSTIPIGAMATLDANNKCLILEEVAVV